MESAGGLLPSPDLIDRTLRIENSYTVSRMRVLESIPGNPVGIQFRPIGGSAVALMARHFPNPHFNKVVGLRAGQEGEIEPLIGWYRENRVKARFEILPRADELDLGRELARLGFYPSEFHTSLLRDAIPGALAKSSIDVERVTGAAAMEEFLDAYIAGWQIPADHDGFRRNVRPWLVQQGWSLFLARVEGKPAATAILYVEDGAGYLADASCDPAYRRRGLHAALLERRIREGSATGVRFICGGAAFLSASHRNMERAGMRIQFIRSIWTERA
jgi:ribosomal protein S18 acetylase RimI-like enzyme